MLKQQSILKTLQKLVYDLDQKKDIPIHSLTYDIANELYQKLGIKVLLYIYIIILLYIFF